MAVGGGPLSAAHHGPVQRGAVVGGIAGLEVSAAGQQQPDGAAAYHGSADAVRLLLSRGADLEARDTTYDSPPLDWAAVGSGERPATNRSPDWIATVQALLDAGASTEGITLSPDAQKPPSPEVAAVLRQAMAP